MPLINIIKTRQDIAARLQAAGIDDPLREAAYLLSAALDLSRGEMLALDELALSDLQAARLAEFIQRRAAREPLARIIGEKEFWGLPFHLNADTLVPRPDTEVLVEAVLAALPDREGAYRILDLGTGTGCILLSLLHELPNASGVGADLAPGAVAMAVENAGWLKLDGRAHFVVSDWLAAVEGEFDIIVSNPPYIAPDEKLALMAEVAAHDPALALFADGQGLDAYRALVPAAWARLKPGGVMALEIGQGQEKPVAGLFPEGVETTEIPDLAGIIRVIRAMKA